MVKSKKKILRIQRKGKSIYACGSRRNVDELRTLHFKMCCPGVKRLFHLVKVRNLPFGLSDVEEVCKNCPTCCELKPKFYRPEEGMLIKATQPWENFSIDHNPFIYLVEISQICFQKIQQILVKFKYCLNHLLLHQYHRMFLQYLSYH